MGSQHVTLNIGEDGLVKSIGHDMGGSYEYQATANERYIQQEIPFPDNKIYEECISTWRSRTCISWLRQ